MLVIYPAKKKKVYMYFYFYMFVLGSEFWNNFFS